jgi:hypothetical protein
MPVAGLSLTGPFSFSTPCRRQIVFDVFQGEYQSGSVYTETVRIGNDGVGSVEHWEFFLKRGGETRAFHLVGARLPAAPGHIVTIISAAEDEAGSKRAARLEWMKWVALACILGSFIVMFTASAVTGVLMLLFGLIALSALPRARWLLKRHGPYVLAKNHSTNERFLLPLAQRVRLIVGRTWLQSVLIMVMILDMAIGLLVLAAAAFEDATADVRIVTVAMALVLMLPGLLIARWLWRGTRHLQTLFDEELVKIENAADRADAARRAQVRSS